MLWTVLWVGTAIYFVLGLALSIYPPYVQDKAYVLEAVSASERASERVLT